MIDPKLLKENPRLIEDMLKKRKLIDFPLNELLDLDKRRKEIISNVEEAKYERNTLAHSISLKKKSQVDTTEEIRLMKGIGVEISNLEREKIAVEAKYLHLMMLLPNIIFESVPLGKAAGDNIIVKKNGTMRKFDFKPKDHIDIATSLDLIDIERAAKIAGARFYFLKNDLVRMNQALMHLALDLLSKNGYTLAQPPYMIRKKAMEGAIILSDFENVIYKIEGDDLYLIGTSEHAMASMHMNEILDGRKLPMRYAGVSPCFRKEAGAHGKDMKGIFRVHQFEKVEQFVYSRPEYSVDEHERMLVVAEEFYEKLGIPCRVMLLCSGELGKISAKTYDIEAWMPGQNAYREIVSCSNCVDYQARRLHVRFRDRTNEKTQLVHTLNSTLVATERTIVSIIENYQTNRGTIEVPYVLQRYMDDKREISLNPTI